MTEPSSHHRHQSQSQSQPQSRPGGGSSLVASAPSRLFAPLVAILASCHGPLAPLASSFPSCAVFASSHRRVAPAPGAVRAHRSGDEEGAGTERVRAAVFQAPARPAAANPLEILLEATGALRVAAAHQVDVVVFPELYLTGIGPGARTLDREAQDLNVLGNVCGELGVAVVAGYAESPHESEKIGGSACYSSMAEFHADGSRAGNFRSVDPSPSTSREGEAFLAGNPFVEVVPTLLGLPDRAEKGGREVRMGLLCGGDLSCPEHARHLVRSGARAVIVSGSFRKRESRRAECTVPTRAMENGVPVMFANYEEAPGSNGPDASGFIGSSAIVAPSGDFLACGLRERGEGLPHDVGYLLPCESGTLYAADLGIETGMPAGAQQSIERYDLLPLLAEETAGRGGHKGKPKLSAGFGRSERRRGGSKKKAKR